MQYAHALACISPKLCARQQPDSLSLPEGSAPVLNALCTPMTGGGACGAPVLYGDIGGEPRPRGPAPYKETRQPLGHLYRVTSEL